MNAIPIFENKIVDWVPVDVAASCITELLFTNQNGNVVPLIGRNGDREGEGEAKGNYEVHNIVNPHPIPWKDLLSLLQASSISSTPMRELPIQEWVSRLSSLVDKDTDIPGLRLLHFFEKMAVEETETEDEGKRKGEGNKILIFETEKTRGIIKALRECGAVCREWIEGNVRVWREGGFIN